METETIQRYDQTMRKLRRNSWGQFVVSFEMEMNSNFEDRSCSSNPVFLNMNHTKFNILCLPGMSSEWKYDEILGIFRFKCKEVSQKWKNCTNYTLTINE